jgi:hypothetical protein
LKEHFQFTYLDNTKTRVYFYIYKRIDPSTWSVSYVSKDIISLKLTNRHSKDVYIFNVYNEVTTDTLSILAEALGTLDLQGETLLLRDFNLHHPV